MTKLVSQFDSHALEKNCAHESFYIPAVQYLKHLVISIDNPFIVMCSLADENRCIDLYYATWIYDFIHENGAK